jgi:hypothetical protein
MAEEHDKKRYIGKYKGIVTQPVDPNRQGKCQVMVPEISPTPLLSFAEQIFPVGGHQSGQFRTPVVGECVWVEFLGGDLDRPLIVGGRYENPLDVPALAQLTPPGVAHWQNSTPGQHTMAMSDMPGPTGGFTFLTPSGAGIKITSQGVFIQATLGSPIGRIEITAAGVFINGTALVIT